MTPDITEHELRLAYRASGLSLQGWTFKRAVETVSTYIDMRATVRALRNKEQQQHGKPAPIQRALQIDNPAPESAGTGRE